MKLKVNKGGTIIGPNRRVYRPGDIIPEGVLTSKQIDAHIQAGYLSAFNRAEATPQDRDVLVEGAPGVQTNLGADEDGNPVQLDVPRRDPAQETSIEIRRRWEFDPDGLRGTDLDSLNVMIAERDPDVDPFETTEEAISWLSQDWAPPTKES